MSTVSMSDVEYYEGEIMDVEPGQPTCALCGEYPTRSDEAICPVCVLREQYQEEVVIMNERQPQTLAVLDLDNLRQVSPDDLPYCARCRTWSVLQPGDLCLACEASGPLCQVSPRQWAGEQVAIDRTLKYLVMLRKNWVSARQRGDAKGMYRCERAARRKKDVCNWYFGAELIK